MGKAYKSHNHLLQYHFVYGFSVFISSKDNPECYVVLTKKQMKNKELVEKYKADGVKIIEEKDLPKYELPKDWKEPKVVDN